MDLIATAAASVTMTSLELVDFVNDYRKGLAIQAGCAFPSKGHAALQHKDFLEKVPVVLGPTSAKFSADLPDTYGRSRTGYRFPKREACLMAMSYSYELQARVFDRMTALEQTLIGARATPLTPAQMFLQSAQLMANLEARQIEQSAAISRVEQRIEHLAETRAFTSCPSNAESITHIRKRIGEAYGLSGEIIAEVLRQSPYAPKPAGEVKNQHEEANGSTYTVWWKKDVSSVFKRFVAECSRVTPVQCTHPFIDRRFKLSPVTSGSAETRHVDMERETENT